MKEENKVILKVLVGSRAHGLANEDSDYDYRGVFVQPTKSILSLGGSYKSNSWFEGKEDQTMYEIGHFLFLATKCNPSILEVFQGPRMHELGKNGEVDDGLWRGDDFGTELKRLFPYVWNPKDAFNAFVGYSSNQRKKLLDKKDDRAPKFACAYLRTIYNLECLLQTGTFTLDVNHNPKLHMKLVDIRNGLFKPGAVIDEVEERIEKCKIYRDQSQQKPNLEKVNDFLLKMRKEFWDD